MEKITVIYHSQQYGNTKILAEALADDKVKRGQATFSSTQVSLKSRPLCIPRNSPIIFFRKSSLSPF